ncbi:MAG: hypothetical protein WDZ93_01840 [Candidatus Paceibacterota bacterium]
MSKNENEEHWFFKGLREGGARLVSNIVVYSAAALVVFFVLWWSISVATGWISAPLVALRDMVGGGVAVVTDVAKDTKDTVSEKARDAFARAKENAKDLIRRDNKETGSAPEDEPTKCWREWIPLLECSDEAE